MELKKKDYPKPKVKQLKGGLKKRERETREKGVWRNYGMGLMNTVNNGRKALENAKCINTGKIKIATVRKQ